jgi:hypothetical protein
VRFPRKQFYFFQEFRDKTNDLFVSLAEANVPVLLLSAGVGDLVKNKPENGFNTVKAA